jgi:hypothetical protein
VSVISPNCFSTQRAKCKKIQRKSKSDGEKGDKDKDDKIKQESPDSDYIMDSSYGQPLNPNLPFSPDGKSCPLPQSFHSIIDPSSFP